MLYLQGLKRVLRVSISNSRFIFNFSGITFFEKLRKLWKKKLILKGKISFFLLKTNYSFVIEYYFIYIYIYIYKYIHIKECDCELCDCKIRSLSICSISCCTRQHVFTSFLPQLDWFELFQLLVNYVKVNKTQRIST